MRERERENINLNINNLKKHIKCHINWKERGRGELKKSYDPHMDAQASSRDYVVVLQLRWMTCFMFQYFFKKKILDNALSIHPDFG